MNRLELTRRITNLVSDDVALVAGIGNAGFDLFSAGHRPANFYMLGSMGLAVPIGLGLALAQPERPVVVMEGEGSVLMNLGALATVGREAPRNLTIVIWDNGMWQLTGGQIVATIETTDLAAVARACGIGSASLPENADEFERTVRYAVDAPGPHVIVAKIDASPAPGRHHDDPVAIKFDFMAAMGQRPD
jgi:thiamine pyrophosphate-dependent acetolactate synthase large subunit-like protein